MPDNLTRVQRHRAMSAVPQRDTAPEQAVRSLLHHLGYRFRKNVKSLPGSPDIVLPRLKSVIFVHGCFWHQHSPCKRARRPGSNLSFWNAKLDKNIERDRKTLKLLQKSGWKVFVVWQCQLRNITALERSLNQKLTRRKLDLKKNTF
jgi:DNA mismatch endonuclease, patch repair protein